MLNRAFKLILPALFLYAGGLASASVFGAEAGPSYANLAARCVHTRNDDVVRGYAPALDARLRAAFRRLFPEASSPPSRSVLRAEAAVRCMNGRLYACFVGANLPCAKINATRENPGADAWCKSNPDSDVVPLVATGHDAEYSYKCVGGRAVVSDRSYALDPRGFAKKLWTPLD